MGGLRTLQDLYAHNAWANAQVFEISRRVDRVALEESAPGTYGTLAETLTHLVSVEDAYLLMLRGESLAAMGSREAYRAHDMDWFAERSLQLGRVYGELLANVDAAFCDEPLSLPWFDFPLTKHDGLLQVLTHSAQHRAQIFSVLGERGVKVPDLDYVIYMQRQREL